MAEEGIFRGCLKNLPPSVWGDIFSLLHEQDFSELESHMKEVESHKQIVKNMLLESTKKFTENIWIINVLCRLGVSYHFEDEIEEQLGRILIMVPKILEGNDYDLCTLANLFRILRQRGYNVTSDVFKKFKDEDEKFKKDIAKDVKGMLCLYEACFMANGKDILDEALAFTRKHLEILAEKSNPKIQKHIMNTLMYPSHRTMERLDTLHYITFFNEDESANETLLKFAKLDFNCVQLLYKKELHTLFKWWKNTKAVENLPFLRDRLMEGYIWGLGLVSEPQYSLSRMLICKYIAVLTLVDDTYDSYGTINELQLFTAAIQRFNKDGVDELPEYMKFIYNIMLELFETDDTQGCSCKTSYAKEMIKELLGGYNVEANWQNERKVPSFDEYMKNGNVTSAYNALTAAFVLGMENIGMKEIVWVLNDPEIIVAAKFFPRFLNDIDGVRTDETKRGDFPKAIDCYMKQYGVSQDESITAILKIVENNWKVMNEYLLKANYSVPSTLLKYTFNFARTSTFFYQGVDFFTYGSNMKQVVLALLMNPLPM